MRSSRRLSTLCNQQGARIELLQASYSFEQFRSVGGRALLS